MTDYKHGWFNHPLYRIRTDMIRRCYNPNRLDYSRYGGRGINVCHSWRESVSLFCEWAIKNGWADGLQLDRIDNNGDYAPDNCRFISSQENNRNRRDNNDFIGVSMDKNSGKWKAQRAHGYGKRHIGLFNTHYAASYARWASDIEQLEAGE